MPVLPENSPQNPRLAPSLTSLDPLPARTHVGHVNASDVSPGKGELAPPLDPSEKQLSRPHRTEKITIRFTPEEKTALQNKYVGQDMSDGIRGDLFPASSKPPSPLAHDISADICGDIVNTPIHGALVKIKFSKRVIDTRRMSKFEERCEQLMAAWGNNLNQISQRRNAGSATELETLVALCALARCMEEIVPQLQAQAAYQTTNEEITS